MPPCRGARVTEEPISRPHNIMEDRMAAGGLAAAIARTSMAVVAATGVAAVAAEMEMAAMEADETAVEVATRSYGESPTFDLPAAKRDSIRSIFRSNASMWYENAEIAKRIPGGWGGYASGKHGIAIHLVDTTQRKAAIEALKAAGVKYVGDTTEVVQGRWTFVQLAEWHTYVIARLRGVKISMVAVDDYRQRITYGLHDENDSAELDRQISALNVPCYLFGREILGPARLAAKSQ
jgi:hypothetical protein